MHKATLFFLLLLLFQPSFSQGPNTPIPISEKVRGLLNAFTAITTPNAMKGVINKRIFLRDSEISKAPIDPVHLPIINPPQYNAMYFAL